MANPEEQSIFSLLQKQPSIPMATMSVNENFFKPKEEEPVDTDDFSFGRAFAFHRERGNGTFKWRGKMYHTKTKEETQKDTPQGQQPLGNAKDLGADIDGNSTAQNPQSTQAPQNKPRLAAGNKMQQGADIDGNPIAQQSASPAQKRQQPVASNTSWDQGPHGPVYPSAVPSPQIPLQTTHDPSLPQRIESLSLHDMMYPSMNTVADAYHKAQAAQRALKAYEAINSQMAQIKEGKAKNSQMAQR